MFRDADPEFRAGVTLRQRIARELLDERAELFHDENGDTYAHRGRARDDAPARIQVQQLADGIVLQARRKSCT